MIKISNDPAFDADTLADSLGDRIVLTSGQRWAIVEQSADLKEIHDASRQTAFLDWHIDGHYHNPPPRFVLLHCINPGTEDIPTQFVDVHAVMSKISGDVALVLNKLRINYIDKGSKLYPQTEPLLSMHGLNLSSRAYVDPISTEVLTEIPSLRQQTEALYQLYKTMDDNVCLEHHWKKHDIVIFDQSRIIHRRVGIGKTQGNDYERKLTRMWWR